MAETMPTTKDGQPIGAWVLKARLADYDAHGAFEYFGVIDAWAVQSNYRADLLAAGQPVVLYIGQDRARSCEPGIWGVGTITGPAHASRAGQDGFWRDPLEMRRHRRFVSVEIHQLVTPVLCQELEADPVLRECELLRSPRMGNPGVLRPDEWRALQARPLATMLHTVEQKRAIEMEATAHDSDSDDFDEEPLIILRDGPNTVVLLGAGGEDDHPFKLLQAGTPSGEFDDGSALVASFADFEDGLEAILARAEDLGPRAPSAQMPAEDADEDEVAEIEPLVIIPLEDGGQISIIKVDPGIFVVAEPTDDDESEIHGTYEDLPSAIVAVFEADDDEDASHEQ